MFYFLIFEFVEKYNIFFNFQAGNCTFCIAVVDDNGVVFDASPEDHHSGETHLSRLRSLDVSVACPVVADGLPHVFPAPLQPLSGPITGFAFNIYNNIWDTNYVMWYPYHNADADFRARFFIDF